MKVKTLIEALQNYNPEARVYLMEWVGKPIREALVAYRIGKNKDIILEDATQFDVENEIEAMFEHYLEEGIDETDAYQEMIDWGYTPDVIAEYYKEEVAEHMRKYCDEHGIEY